ncbi:hypothetical protein EJ08DRAFT_728536 [Tothia fuscella]|uniref:BRCT domain-containing protein n=1 Tax=Tothia fuscella TaxID=1048955 RepID=A0A9P4P5C1_9PEZI|nr:hypothetical protein EJ08DRAFT_728536 [Tothia fuscella]
MESLDSNATLDTQTILKIKHKLLGDDQSEGDPHTRPLRVDGHVVNNDDENEGDGDGNAVNPPPPALEASNLNSPTPPTSITNSPISGDLIKSRRVESDHAPPRLLPLKSLPVVSTTVAGHKVTASKMYHSFGGFLEGMGDTQPIDSQTFVQHSDLNISRDFQNHIAQQEIEDNTIGGNSYHEGDTGFMDLIGDIAQDTGASAVQEPIDLSAEEEEVDHDDFSSLAGGDDADELSPETQLRIDARYSHTFIQPKTPATKGKKRNRNGEVISSQIRTSTTKTPGSDLAAIFGKRGAFDGGLSMTQIFQTTQAVSSPLPDGPRSDPVFERPSPNLNFHQRPTSPIPMAVSSPMKQYTSDSQIRARVPSDPLDNYLTLKESQERRRKLEELERKRLNQQAEADVDEFLDDETEEGRQYRHRQEQMKIRENAMTSCIDLKAPPRSGSGGPTKPSQLARRKSATDISSEIFQDTPRPHRTPRKALKSIPASDALTDEDSLDELSPDKRDVQVPRTSSLPIENSQTLARNLQSTQQPHTSQARRLRRGVADTPNATQKTVAVADSQSERVTTQRSRQQSPNLLLRSSHVSNSQVGQTQLSIASQKRVALLAETSNIGVRTSSPPRPPTESIPVVEDDKMPSSPPAMPIEDSKPDDALDIVEDDVQIATADTHLQDELSRSKLDFDEEGQILPEGSGTNNGKQITPASSTAQKGVASGTNQSTEVFETAPSHLSASPRKQNSDHSARNSPHITRIRKLTEIAADPTPENSFESVDLDINLITEQEQQEHEELEKLFSGSSPVRPNKRRKVYTPSWKRALREPAKNLNSQPEEPSIRDVTLEAEREVSPTPNAPASVRKTKMQSPPTSSSKQRSRVSELPISPKAIAKPPPKNAKPKSKLPVTRAPTVSGRPKPRKLRVMEVAETPQPGAYQQPKTKSHSVQNARPPPALVVDTTVGNTTAPQVSTPAENEPACFVNRVLARFRGAKMAFYPATCVGVVHGDGVRYRIRFDDGTVDNVDAAQIRKLQLRSRDLVKVDLPDMRTKTYVVCGFKDKVAPQTDSGDELAGAAQEAFPLTDVYGYRTVQLAVKTRDSFPAPDASAVELIEVPITNIYVTSTMWTPFADRKFVDGTDDPVALHKRISTPSVILSEPSTPTSRARRQAGFSLLSAHIREQSTASFRRESGLFSNMTFAVTFMNADSTAKTQSIKSISDNGGILLDAGFDELFDVNFPEPLSPKKPARASAPATTHCPEPLRLRPSAQKLGFTALIADRYCRRAKYMQALALDIPCLHFRWLTDCIAASTVLPFQNYLLPAGESAFLSGAVRSRVITPYDPSSDNGNLENVLARRKLLLGEKNVLLVMGKGRAEEKRKAYLFLTYALGAANVGRVKDLNEAKACLDRGDWDWIYVDGDVGEAEKALYSSAANGGEKNGQKRKRSDDNRVKVVGDEFVIQSLILGALMEA